MFWMTLSLISAVLLGFYDIAKKMAARDNAVPMVLLISTSVGAAIWIPLLLVQTLWRGAFPVDWLRVEPLSAADHGWLILKSVLVGTSWTLALFALKHLPLSIAAPVRSTSPLWTILIAIVFLGERPTLTQWLGIAIVLVSFWGFSVVGRKEGIRFASDRWIGLMVIATVLGALSSIYDKVLLQQFHYRPATVQAWFTIYLVPVMMPLAVGWQRRRRASLREFTTTELATGGSDRRAAPSWEAFEFRRSILWISPLLLAADMVYFTALAHPEALVSVVSTLRRCSVVVALVIGGRQLGEVNLRRKGFCVAGILAGVVLVLLPSP